MKKQILEIMELEGHKEMIKTQEMTIYYDKSDCASEIADMVKAFMSWKDNSWVDYNKIDKVYNYHYSISGFYHFGSIDELFNYWYANIKDK